MVEITQSRFSKQITSLDDLVEHLDQGNFNLVTSQLESIEFTYEELEQFASWSEEKYTRNLINRTEEYELILLCWEPGQETAIHGHDDNECWVKVLSGEFEEKTYALKGDSFEPTGDRKLETFEVTSATTSDFLHSLKNSDSGRAMSLHLYMEPIDECEVYIEEEGCFKTVTMTYDTQ